MVCPPFLFTNNQKCKNMKEYELQASSEYKTAMELENALNNTCFDYDRFAENIRYMHPTLQQNLFRLIGRCIYFMADEKKRYIDPRNRASYEISKKLLEVLKDEAIPYI